MACFIKLLSKHPEITVGALLVPQQLTFLCACLTMPNQNPFGKWKGIEK